MEQTSITLRLSVIQKAYIICFLDNLWAYLTRKCICVVERFGEEISVFPNKKTFKELNSEDDKLYERRTSEWNSEKRQFNSPVHL